MSRVVSATTKRWANDPTRPPHLPFDPSIPPTLSSDALARSITKQASFQTYLTIRVLADSDRKSDAFKAYAYFRWLDDLIDQTDLLPAEKQALLARQREIMARGHDTHPPVDDLCPEERLLAELAAGLSSDDAGLQHYIDHMFAVITFDAERRGHLTTEAELTAYSRHLAFAVTEALHHFIGHSVPDPLPPQPDRRISAVTGAHITHMLRDLIEDIDMGYVNISAEILAQHQLSCTDIHHPAFQGWVRDRVALARHHFAMGKAEVAQTRNLRRRLAGFAYIGRFEVVLRQIERDNFILREAYPQRRSKRNMLAVTLRALGQTLWSLFR